MIWTKESLQEVSDTHGIKGLREVAMPLGIKSNSTQGIIEKILEKQSEEPPEPSDHTIVCSNSEQCPNFEELSDSLEKFGQRFNFTFAYMHKFRSFRCYREGKEVDWISINELRHRYQLNKVPQALGAVRSYQPPTERAYQ